MPADSVTVVIPTCERWKLLRRTLSGALAQRDVELEVVVVNDGRTPPPHDLFDGDAPVRVIEPAAHRGVGAARNAGIGVARGEWIAVLDDDDLWAPDKLATQLRACAQRDAAWSYTGGVYVDERLAPFERLITPPPERLLELLFRYQAIPGACSNLLVRADLLDRLGGFDEGLHQLADWDLCLRLAAAAPAAAVADVLLAYVQHSRSMLVTSSVAALFQEYDALRAKHAVAARDAGCAFDPELFSFWVATRLEKAGHRRRAARESLRAALHYREPALLANAARLTLSCGTPESARGDAGVPTPAWLERYSPAALV